MTKKLGFKLDQFTFLKLVTLALNLSEPIKIPMVSPNLISKRSAMPSSIEASPFTSLSNHLPCVISFCEGTSINQVKLSSRPIPALASSSFFSLSCSE